jgi:hypothetical protein
MWNGASACACANSNSFGMDDRQARTLPWPFQAAMPIVRTLVMGG